MNNQTLDIVQDMLKLIRAQSKRIASLEAHTALQNHALAALLESAVPSAEAADAYEAVRQSARDIAAGADEQEGFRSLLRVMDSKFLSPRD